MFEILQKSLFAGVGLGYMAKEKVEEIGKKILEEAKVGETEGKKFLDELQRRTEAARLAMEKMVNDTVSAAMDKLDIVKRRDIDGLEKRISDLEKKMGRKE
jgi:polyhydroxyalkanoate synthesis regulator phasin